MNDFARGPCAEAVAALSPRQRQVLTALASGEPRKEVAVRLGMSEHTFRTHCQTIYALLGIHSEVEATRMALAAKIL